MVRGARLAYMNSERRTLWRQNVPLSSIADPDRNAIGPLCRGTGRFRRPSRIGTQPNCSKFRLAPPSVRRRTDLS